MKSSDHGVPVRYVVKPCLRKRTRRLPCRSVFHEHCFGNPLLVCSLGQNLIPWVGVIAFRRHWLADDDDNLAVTIDLDAGDLLARFLDCFHRSRDITLAEDALTSHSSIPFLRKVHLGSRDMQLS